MGTYICDIAVYRCSEQHFEQRLNKALDKHLADLEKRSGGVTRTQAPTVFAGAEESFREAYAAPWRFNQIIAWLRLCASTSSVCVDLWLCDARHFLRVPRRRIFHFRGAEMVIRVRPQDGSRDIFEAILKRLDEYEEAWKRRGFVLDHETIEQLGPFVDWRRVVNEAGGIQSPKWLEGFNGTRLSLR